jgi:glutathione S-transferase
MIELHGFPMSPNTKRARLGLEEAGVSYKFFDVDLMSGAHKEPAYLLLNPTARVPALVDGDYRLWESNAMLEYVAEIAKDKRLGPDSPRERGDIAKWMFMGAAHLSPNIARIFAHTIRLPEEKRIPQLVTEGRAEVDRCLLPLNDALAGKTWLVGDRLTIADISLAPPLTAAPMLSIDLTRFEHVTAWLARITSRESWKRVNG